MGRHVTVEHNLFFGLDIFTVNDHKHTISHNTGDCMNILAELAAIRVKPDGPGGVNVGAKTMRNAASIIFLLGMGKYRPPGSFKDTACQQ